MAYPLDKLNYAQLDRGMRAVSRAWARNVITEEECDTAFTSLQTLQINLSDALRAYLADPSVHTCICAHVEWAHYTRTTGRCSVCGCSEFRSFKSMCPEHVCNAS